MLWLITRWDWLMMAGYLTLFGGVALLLVGSIALARYCCMAFRTPDFSRWRLWLSTLACAGLLLLNFPVAGGVIDAVISMETSYSVLVYNASQQPLESVRIYGGGCDESLGSIPPGGVVSRTFRFQSDGELKFYARTGNTRYTETIVGYVTGNMGGHTTVKINPDGTISYGDDYD